jgi:hypothetical protein
MTGANAAPGSSPLDPGMLPEAACRRARRPARFRGLCPLLAGALLLLLPFGVAAADDLAGALGRSGYGRSERAEIERFFQEAERWGIPEGLLLPRLEEGVAKRVGCTRLLSALKLEREHLLEARSLLERTHGGEVLLADAAAWARTANLLAAGVSPEEVEALADASRARPGDFRGASYLYVALRDWGLPPELSLALARDVLASALRGESFPGILDLLGEGRRRRLAPEEIVARIREQLRRAHSLEELRELLY